MKINLNVVIERHFKDLTTKQRCSRILYFLCLFMLLPIWIPSAVIFMVIEAVVEYLRDKLYYNEE